VTAPDGDPPVPGLRSRLAAAVGPDHVLTDPAVTMSYGTDWTGRWRARPLAVVRPGSTAEVAATIRVCADAGVPVVPQGGNTGLVGGSVPRGDGRMVVLSTRRLATVGPLDRGTRSLVVGAGASLSDVHRAAARVGLRYAVDLAARDSATVGGTVATNAAGLRALGLGDTRRQVVGVEAVLADGTVVDDVTGPPAGRDGFPLAGLLCGSEGTLAVITAARLRLGAPPAVPPVTLLVGLTSPADALALLDQPGLTAAELLLRPGLELVCRVGGLPDPLPRAWPAYLLLEVEGEPVLPDDVDAVVDPRVWAYREGMTDAIATLGIPHKLDVALPVDAVPAFVAELPAVVTPFAVHPFGHLGVGNVHVNVVDVGSGPGRDPDRAGLDAVDERVVRLVHRHGGAVAAEHGIGVAKVQWVGPDPVRTRLKCALDPAGLLNPGVATSMR
jgi:FAD/FMN-containing dehydrogenase